MKEGVDATEGVHVGDVLVRLGGQKKKEGKAGVPEKERKEIIGNYAQPTDQEA
ncbi:hypothetical protein A2U01_0105631, partial [Trifolium medium]|nr:hypothetical protein [Trifolium medium]